MWMIKLQTTGYKKGSFNCYGNFLKILYICRPQKQVAAKGGLAQLARALAWHARGRRFDPDTLHF